MTLIHIDDRELIDILADTLQIMTCALLEGSRNTESYYDSCNCCMYSGIEHHIPEHQSEDDIEGLRTALETVCNDHYGDTYGRQQQEGDIYL